MLLLTDDGSAKLADGRRRWNGIEDEWADLVGRDRLDVVRGRARGVSRGRRRPGEPREFLTTVLHVDADFPAVLAALEQQHAELADLLDNLTPSGWARATRCEGWDVADVVLHLAQTDDYAIASLRDELGDAVRAQGAFLSAADVDAGAAAMVKLERGGSGDDTRDRWSRNARELRELMQVSDPHRRVQWVAGELSIHTLASTRVSECWIHTGDVSEALDIPIVPSDRLYHIARLAWRTLPYAFARAGEEGPGPVAFELRAPGGDLWSFTPDAPTTVVRGDAFDLCMVAARRVEPAETGLRADGPDGEAVLRLVRTYA